MVNAKITEDFLKNIAKRLSGRVDCKQLKYVIVVTDKYISMNPLITVYPNRYKRKDTDRLDVVSYVYQYMMQDVKLNDFVPGTYEYQLSSDGKHRKWRKVK